MFRSRKRGREVPSKANVSNNKADVATADAAAAAPTPAEKQQHPVAAFANTVYVDPVVKSVYRYVDKKSYLNWGLTSDWLVEGPRKRRASAAASGLSYGLSGGSSGGDGGGGGDGVAAGTGTGMGTGTGTAGGAAVEEVDEDPNASSEGYGEMTEGSIERLLVFLKTLTSNKTLAAPLPAGAPPPLTPPNSASKTTRKKLSSSSSSSPPSSSSAAAAAAAAAPPDPRWNLTPSSGFIDVGSGYGKVVLHAKLSAKVGRAAGIEYVAARAQMAIAAKDELARGTHAFMTEEARELLRGDGCVLEDGDATKYGVFDFSHVYMYDKVFSDPTIELLAGQLNASPYRVLVSYQRIEVWRRLGLENVVEVAALTMRTTGGQNFKAYVYVNLAQAAAS